MKLLLLHLSAVLATACAVSFSQLGLEEWATYKLAHNKYYDTISEERYRLKVFLENKLKVARHNAKFARGEVTYTMGINQFADLRDDEFNRMMNRLNTSMRAEPSAWWNITEFVPPVDAYVPSSIDWRGRGYVTPVKNQGHCGACWAFSATGALEGQHFRKTRRLVSLSEQNLIDCSRRYGNHGCGGGDMGQAFKYVRDNRGIDNERRYPYEGRDNVCRYRASNRAATASGLVTIQRSSERQLQQAVGTVGPVAVGVDASRWSHYSGGVFVDKKCYPNDINHGVLVVGYGTERGQPYWLAKNSWGEGWGERGYIKIARNRGNQCCIASDASYPKV